MSDSSSQFAPLRVEQLPLPLLEIHISSRLTRDKRQQLPLLPSAVAHYGLQGCQSISCFPAP